MKTLDFNRIIVVMLLSFLLIPPVIAQQNLLNDMKIFTSDTLFSFEFICDQVPFYNSFPYVDTQQEVPYKIVVDLKNSKLNLNKNTFEINKGPIYRIRVSQWMENPAVVRIVFDLIDRVDYTLKPTGNGLSVILSGFDRGEEQIVSAQQEVGEREKEPQITTDEVQIQEERVALINYENNSLVEILQVFAELHGLNIVTSTDVNPDDRITVNLKDVPVKSALDALLIANNYNYVNYNKCYYYNNTFCSVTS